MPQYIKGGHGGKEKLLSQWFRQAKIVLEGIVRRLICSGCPSRGQCLPETRCRGFCRGQPPGALPLLLLVSPLGVLSPLATVLPPRGPLAALEPHQEALAERRGALQAPKQVGVWAAQALLPPSWAPHCSQRPSLRTASALLGPGGRVSQQDFLGQEDPLGK